MSSLDKYSFPTPNGGLLLSTQGGPNGNMCYATAQYCFLEGAYELSFFKGLNSLMPKVGVLSRSPTSQIDTSIDDYLAYACLAHFADLFYQRGWRSWGCYTLGSKWSWTQWLWRWPYYWVHVKINAGKTVWPIGRLFWAANLIYVTWLPISNQDQWLEAGLMVLSSERRGYRSFIGSLAVKYWKKKKPVPLWQVMKSYLALDEHPLIDAWETQSI